MKKILLLDDNLDIVQIVAEVLTYEGYQVQSVSTCTGFLSVIAGFEPDLILLDYRLRDGNGGELCRQIKNHTQFSYIPVVLFTAYAQRDFGFENFGFDGFIAKPFDLDELIETVQGLLYSDSHGFDLADH
ncbi:response regulator [Mucilaginibacter gossypii]|uniref:Response regulator receiver domain-containing protein n=1 Tax=Mucilaginibacter gossypii TaxID=551996 RepID=A0A1G8AC99_9SPHI|nr:response regulator [Mucilaginibacter gossypii]SDH18519.1 Response regulator receiver domain-containing protein [Mucilaginibacter gossypii]